MREEDEASCSLGIFGIYGSLIYGEGKCSAIKRLQKEVRTSFESAVGTLVNGTEVRSRSRGRLGEICQWLTEPDPTTNYHKSHKQWKAETGLWLLESEKILGWKVGAVSRLWSYGILGCSLENICSSLYNSK